MTPNPQEELAVFISLWNKTKPDTNSLKSLFTELPKKAQEITRKIIMTRVGILRVLSRVPTGLTSEEEKVARSIIKEIDKRFAFVPKKMLEQLLKEAPTLVN